MYREPDWETLNDLNFLLHNRLVRPLNGALTSLEKVTTADSSLEWWRNRATSQVSTAINLINAWSWLVQYKASGEIPERSIQSFPIQNLADWLTMQLQLIPPLIIQKNFLIRANQPTLQEAILLLHSAAASQGTETKLILDTGLEGVTFRVCFKRLRQDKPLTTLEEMLNSLGKHWRGDVITFELKIAREFLLMNSSLLHLQDDGEQVAFVFIVPRRARAENGDSDSHLLIPSHDSQAVINIVEAMLPEPIQMDGGHTNPAVIEPPSTIPADEIWQLKPTTIKAATEIPTSIPSVRVMVPDTPFRPGGWHRPKKDSSPPAASAAIETAEVNTVILKVELPTPAEPGNFKVKSRRLAIKRDSQPMPQMSATPPVAQTGPQQILQETPAEKIEANPSLSDNSEPSQTISADSPPQSSPLQANGHESQERKQTNGL